MVDENKGMTDEESWIFSASICGAMLMIAVCYCSRLLNCRNDDQVGNRVNGAVNRVNGRRRVVGRGNAVEPAAAVELVDNPVEAWAVLIMVK